MFSLYFTTRDTFPDFLKNNTKYYGEMQLDINPNLASLSQLIFIFLLNFIIICSINIIVRKKVKHRVTR
ncbi:Msa family membrane protein [Staphylococcus gallinarum]|nr:Msa family membrane protein [Staphylococcus gallinarum]